MPYGLRQHNEHDCESFLQDTVQRGVGDNGGVQCYQLALDAQEMLSFSGWARLPQQAWQS